MKNAVIYTRSASPNKLSINAQLELCREYAKTHGYNVIAEYSDNGYSGMNFNRPEFTAMNDSQDKWQTLIVYSIEKLSRNSNDRYKYTKSLRDAGKELVSVSEPCSGELYNILEFLHENNVMQKMGVQRK